MGCIKADFYDTGDASRTEPSRVFKVSCLLQNASPPGMFSFACQKRTRKAPATFEAREARTRGYSPLVTPKLLGSIQKNPSRCARGFFVFRRFKVAARRNVRATACFYADANAPAGSQRQHMPFTVTPLSGENVNRKNPQIFSIYEIKILFPLFMPRATRRAF